MSKFGGGGWGSWHTGPDAKAPCPQDGKWHSLDDAVNLNEKDSEFKRAKMWARHKEWVGSTVKEADLPRRAPQADRQAGQVETLPVGN